MNRYSAGFFHGSVFWVFALVGCASMFPYKYYGVQMAPECYDHGTLLGKSGGDGWPDVPLEECKPDPVNKIKCITLKDDTFYSLKADDEKCHADLQVCQHGAP